MREQELSRKNSDDSRTRLGKIRRRTGALAGALLVVLLGAFVLNTSGIRAQPVNTFPADATVAAGGTITLAITTPGVLVTGTSLSPSCSPTIPPPAVTVTYTCSSGLAIGTLISETFSATSGPILENVTYDANGPITGFPLAPAGAPIGPPTNVCTGSGSGPYTCSGQNTATIVPGGEMQITITKSTAGTLSVPSLPTSIGGCALSSGVQNQASPWKVTYTCSAVQNIPAGTGTFSLAVSQTSLVVGLPAITVQDNANGPVPATPGIPAPSGPFSHTFGGAAAPILSFINPPNGPAGTNVTLTGTNLTGVTAVFFGSTPSTILSCNSTTSCTVTAPALATNTVASVTVVTSSGTSNALTYTFSATTSTGPTNVAFISAVPSAGAGQAVTFTPATATTTASCGSITNYQINWGDGTPAQTSASAIAMTHTYSNAGTFPVTLTVTDCAGGIASTSSSIVISSTTPTPTPTGPTVSLGAGWDLVGGATGTVFAGADGPLYTFQAGDINYESLPSSSGITGGRGYWAYFFSPTVVSMNGSGTTTATIAAPANQWIMAGNPSSTTSVTVRGADAVDTWNGTAYTQGTVLGPGQGAWVISLNGGTITLGP